MRALGPGSVSSFLKVVVEVVHAALWVLLALQLLAVALLLLASPFGVDMLEAGPVLVHITGVPRFSTPNGGVVFMVAFSILYVAVLLVVLAQMRRVLATLIMGDPFHPANIARLRVIGLALVGLEAVGYLLRATVGLFARVEQPWPFSLNASGWFAILVVFVLAEVFREGARLRTEAELTV